MLQSRLAGKESRPLSQPRPSYREIPPAGRLIGIVDRFWLIRGDASPGRPLDHRVVPDGRIDVIFQLGASSYRKAEDPGPAYVVGPMLSAARIHYEGPALTMGTRFAPGAAAALIAPPPTELIDRAVSLQDLWRDVPALVDSLATAPDDRERIARLERALEQRARTDLTLDPAALALEQSAGAIRIADLSRHAGVSERQLERRFRARVGLTPRMARRIARFLRATRILSRNPDTPWQDLMHACGFYDQAHIIHEFRTFAGVTPTQFAAEQRVGFIQDGALDSSEIVFAHLFPSSRSHTPLQGAKAQS